MIYDSSQVDSNFKQFIVVLLMCNMSCQFILFYRNCSFWVIIYVILL